jgi:AcrR family transcriptional regulator
MPRRYDRSRRAAAAAETRQRIVAATEELHTTQGVLATSFEDIAKRAGVAVGTVYRHFPRLDELVAACGEVAMARLALPTRAELAERLAGARSGRERLRRTVAEAYGIYERGGDVVGAIRRDRDQLGHLQEAHGQVEEALAAIVDVGLGERLTDADAPAVRALLDLDAWHALRGQGVTGTDAVETTADVLDAWLARRRRYLRASSPQLRPTARDTP